MPSVTGSSGSPYYYPVAQVTNSSYKSLDLRGLGAAPDTAGGIGRIYVMSGSGDLFYKDPDGNEIFLGSEISSSAGYVTGSTNFFVTNALQVSGTINNSVGHLILSSSAGSYVRISGALRLGGGNEGVVLTSDDGAGTTLSVFRKDATNRASLWVGNITSDGGSTVTCTKVNSGAGTRLILSSSLSVIAFSSSQEFPNSDRNYHIRAVNSNLILSSSVGSVVAISGALRVFNDTTGSQANPPIGSIMFHTTTNQLAVYNGIKWYPLASGTAL